MAPVEGGDGWARPSGAPGQPLPPPPDPGWNGPAASWVPPDAQYLAALYPEAGGAPPPPTGGRWSMTRGWAWTALILLALVPVGIGLSIAYVWWNEAQYDPEEDGFQEAWYLLFVFVFLAAWIGGCLIGALISAIIGTVRSHRKRHLRHSPAIAVLVWVGLGLALVPIALVVLLGNIGG